MRTFSEKVLAVVTKIPKGEVLTYAEVAKRSGSPSAYRAVGSIMKRNYDPNIPCHRVVPMHATLSGRVDQLDAGNYNRGRLEKIRKLKKEGVIR